MRENRVWYAGDRGFQKMSFVPGSPNNTFTIEIAELEERPFNSIHEVFADHLKNATLPVEVLYSGGLDSECVLLSCVQQNIPVIAVTLRILLKGCALNVIDLYHSEKFCRAHDIKHVVIDLDINKFVDNGDYIKYIDQYQNANLSAMTILWLIEQCHSFPVFGGDYTWPLLNVGKLEFSPRSYSHSIYDAFMQDKSIPGIGNFIGYSTESNRRFLAEHVKIYNRQGNLDNLKVQMLENLGFGKLEPRFKSNGWDLWNGQKHNLDISIVENQFAKIANPTTNIIKWGKGLADMIGGVPGENSERYYKPVDK